VYNFHSNSLIFLEVMLNTSHLFLNLMHKVKTQKNWRDVCQKHAYIFIFNVVIMEAL